MPSAGDYEVRSLDHPERVVIVHLEVVEREVLYAFQHRVAELEREVQRLGRENENLRRGLVA